MDIFVLQNIFIKLYIYQFLINIFTKIRSQSYALKTKSVRREYVHVTRKAERNLASLEKEVIYHIEPAFKHVLLYLKL
jgi:hypothetical protein